VEISRSKTLVVAESEKRDNSGMFKVEAQPIAVSVVQAAELLGIHERHIMAAVKSRELSTYQCGIAVRVLTSDLVDWVRSTWKRPTPRKNYIRRMKDNPDAA
jgi:excisionase family DNA binding protein